MFLHQPIMYFQSDVMLCTTQGGYLTNNPQHHSAGNDIKPCHWILADDAQHTTEYEYLCREPSLNAIENCAVFIEQPSINAILISILNKFLGCMQLLAASQVHDFYLSVGCLSPSQRVVSLQFAFRCRMVFRKYCSSRQAFIKQ